MPLLPPTPPSYPPENLYSVLGLPQPSRAPTTSSQHALTTSQIKAAYRRTLLKYHPDKAAVLLPSTPPTTPSAAPLNKTQKQLQPSSQHPIDIDTITLARDILTNPSSRRHYDHHLLFAAPAAQQQQRHATSNPGPPFGSAATAETLDLDDMAHDGAGTWSAPCRCGDDGGYFVREADLVEALAAAAAGAAAAGADAAGGGGATAGEVVVGCVGCSLAVRVLFGVDSVEMQEQEDEGTGPGLDASTGHD